jgi:PAS domain S-box-containing protein
MSTELRKTGISVVGDMPWGTHFCHFYETKQDLLDTLVPYFKAGLESKEYCLWVVSDFELITVEEAQGALAQAVPDLDRHLADGDIEILNGHDWYFEKNVLNLEKVTSAWDAKVQRALGRGYDGLRASADTFWLAEKDWKDFFAYEKQVNDWITNQSMTVMCTYPLAKSGAAEVLDVVESHQFATARRQGEWKVIETPELMQAKQEITRLNEELERRVIERTKQLAATNEELRKEIAERRRAEAALRRSEDHLRLVIDTIPVMAWSLRTDGVVDFLNQRWMDYTGVSLEQYVEEPTRPVHPADIPRVMEKWLADMVAGEPNEDEMRLRRADGEYRWFLVRNAPLRDEQGNVVKWYGISIDIQERKQVEEALKESWRRLEEAQRIAHVGHWERDLRTGVITWSDEIYSILGLERQVSPPTEWQHLIHPEDRERISLVIEEAQRGIRRYDVEYRIVRPDGEVRFIHSQGDIIRDEHGELCRAFGIAQDITKRKQAEEQLRQSESQLAEAQRLAHVGSWNWDLRNNTLIWSDEQYHIFGLRAGQVDPAYETIVAKYVHPEDRDLVKRVIENSLKTQEPFNFYYRILRPDGEERVIQSRGNIVSDEHRNPIRMFGTAQDVTERKHAEEALRAAEQKYRDIFENAGEGIFQSTPDGRYIAANPALARMYEYASPEELIHSRQDISLQVYVDPTRREEFKRQLEERGAVTEFEHEVFRKDSSRLWISVNARAVQDEQGVIQYYEGMVQDITERKAAEEKLKATSEQLRALSARLRSAREEEGTRIAREIHDELGAALTSLRWDLESLDKALSDSESGSQLHVMRERIEAMMKLIDTTVSAIRRITQELRPSVLDDLGLAEAIEWQAQQFQARTGIICHCDCSLEDVALSQEQSTAVFRIFQETLTNILRHAQATRVDITVEEKDGEFVLTINDNGRGITEDQKSGQHSLGLLGMRERAHLIGGKIDITGDEGKGTVVTLRILISG